MVNDPPKTANRKSLPQLCQEWSSRLRARKSDGTAVTKADLKNIEAQMAAMKITKDKAAKGSPGYALPKSSPQANPVSFTISGVDILEEEINQFEDSIEFVKEALDIIKLGDLEDLNEARQSLVKLSETNQALSEYRSSHGNLQHLQAVSFSRLTEKHLADMGVKSWSLPVPNFNQKIDEWFSSRKHRGFMFGNSEENLRSLSEIFETFWQELTSDGKYLQVYRTLMKTVGHKPEARARLLTDYIMVQVIYFLETHLNLIQLVFLELVLAVANKKPVIIEHGNSATLLTGSVDYAIWSSVVASKAIAKKLPAVRNVSDLEKKIRDLTSESSLLDIVEKEIWNDLHALNYFKFAIIEEKRRDLGKKKLKDCEPQVAGEGMAIMKQTEQKSVPWCLSNGEEWLFGILDRDDPWRKRSLPVLTLLDDNKLEESIRAVFKMLIMWTVLPEDVLRRMLNTCN